MKRSRLHGRRDGRRINDRSGGRRPAAADSRGEHDGDIYRSGAHVGAQ